jgi:K+-sensing histidine kinase KdpD
MNDSLNDLQPVLAKMVHDLRTPLSVVHTTTNMLLNPKYQFNEAEVREHHQRIHRNVETLNRLIGELAKLAKPGTADSPSPQDA